jgi:hypothetical protein
MRALREPVLSAISLSFIVRFLLACRRPELGKAPELEGRWLSFRQGRARGHLGTT